MLQIFSKFTLAALLAITLTACLEEIDLENLVTIDEYGDVVYNCQILDDSQCIVFRRLVAEQISKSLQAFVSENETLGEYLRVKNGDVIYQCRALDETQCVLARGIARQVLTQAATNAVARLLAADNK